MVLRVNILKKNNFAFLKNTNFYLGISIKDTRGQDQDPWIPKTLGNRTKFAFIFSNNFCILINNYLGPPCLPFWGFY